jgi:four helix bundle protein
VMGSGEWGVEPPGEGKRSATRKTDTERHSVCNSLVAMHKYQSLIAWQRAHNLALLALRATDAAYHPRARPLFDQIRRAAISVEANIVEGYALGSPRQFRKHLRIAMGSAAEVECLVRMTRELQYLPDVQVVELEDLLSGTMRVIQGLLRTIIRPVA